MREIKCNIDGGGISIDSIEIISFETERKPTKEEIAFAEAIKNAHIYMLSGNNKEESYCVNCNSKIEDCIQYKKY